MRAEIKHWVGIVAILTTSSAMGEIRVVAVSGERVPDNSGVVSELRASVFRTPDRPFFTTTVRENGFLVKHVLLRSGPQIGNLQQIAAEGQPSPDGNGFLSALTREPWSNTAGDAVFQNNLDATLGASREVILLKPANGPIRKVVRQNDPIPGFPSLSFLSLQLLDFNELGQSLVFSSTNNAGEPGLFRIGNGGQIARIALRSDTDPLTGSNFFLISNRGMMNDLGEAVFSATSTGIDSIYRGSGGAISLAAGIGAGAPGGGVFQFFGRNPVINNSGEIVFLSVLTGSPMGDLDNQGLFVSSAQGISQRVRKGNFVPDGNGRFLSFNEPFAINDQGRVAFVSQITGATGNSNEGVFVSNPGGVQLVARVGAPAPGGGTFKNFEGAPDSLALNTSGDLVFQATVQVGQLSVVDGLFIFRSGELKAIARPEVQVAGYGNLTRLVRVPESPSYRGRTWLDDSGNVTFSFFYTGGNSAIGIWTEPGFIPGNLIFKSGFE